MLLLALIFLSIETVVSTVVEQEIWLGRARQLVLCIDITAFHDELARNGSPKQRGKQLIV
jgi:hypothetical protein